PAPPRRGIRAAGRGEGCPGLFRLPRLGATMRRVVVLDNEGGEAGMPARLSVTVDRNVPVPMRDGTILYADVYRPADGERHATLLQRTPYDKQNFIFIA